MFYVFKHYRTIIINHIQWMINTSRLPFLTVSCSWWKCLEFIHFKSVLFTFIHGTSCRVWFCWAVWCKPKTVGYLKTRDMCPHPFNISCPDFRIQQEIHQDKCEGKTVLTRDCRNELEASLKGYVIISLRNTLCLRCHWRTTSRNGFTQLLP